MCLFDSLNPLNKSVPMVDSANDHALELLADLSLDASALNAEIQALRAVALALVISLSDSIAKNELEENELPSDRLNSLIAGISASDDDGEEVEIDEVTYDVVVANIKDALETLGVDESVIDSMFGDDEDAEEAIESATEVVNSNLPEGDDLEEFINIFVYGEAEEDEGALLDGVSLGKTTTKTGKFGKVVYKAVKAIRNGRVKVINKRVSGRVKLSAKQRNALNKARRKATTGGAIKRRVKSFKKSKKLSQ